MVRWQQVGRCGGSGSGAAGLLVITARLVWATEVEWSGTEWTASSVDPFGLVATPPPTTPPPTTPPPPGTRVLAEHISLGGTPSPATMSVAWHTNGPVLAAQVRWGEGVPVPEPPRAGQGSGMRVAAGSTQVYLVSPNRSAYVHRASIGPLVAGRSYSYQAMHEAGPAGLVHTFVMPSDRLAGGGDAAHAQRDTGSADTPPPERVIIFGDSGNSIKWSNGTVPAVAADVRRGGVTAIIHTGDMAYYAKEDDGQRGGTHAEELANATGHSTALMTVVGNGDVFCYRPPGIPAWASCTEDCKRESISTRAPIVPLRPP